MPARSTVLTVSAIYLAVLGLGFMLVPRQIGIDAVSPDASPALVAYLRIFSGPFLGIAVLNWMARNAPPSSAVTPLSSPILWGEAASLMFLSFISDPARQRSSG
jgi:hypothetical protein